MRFTHAAEVQSVLSRVPRSAHPFPGRRTFGLLRPWTPRLTQLGPLFCVSSMWTVAHGLRASSRRGGGAPQEEDAETARLRVPEPGNSRAWASPKGRSASPRVTPRRAGSTGRPSSAPISLRVLSLRVLMDFITFCCLKILLFFF